VNVKARLVREGKNIVNFSCEIKDKDGKLIATGNSNLLKTQYKPEYVKAIIVGDSPLNLRRQKEIAATEGWRRDLKNESEWSGKPYNDLIKIFKDRNPDTDMDQIIVWAETFSNVDPELSYYLSEDGLDELWEGFSVKDSLVKIRIPLLVLQANPEMGMINHEDVEWVRAIMPELSHVYIGETGHWLGINDKQEHLFINAITPFLESLK